MRVWKGEPGTSHGLHEPQGDAWTGDGSALKLLPQYAQKRQTVSRPVGNQSLRDDKRPSRVGSIQIDDSETRSKNVPRIGRFHGRGPSLSALRGHGADLRQVQHALGAPAARAAR